MYRFFRILQRDTINLFINPTWIFMVLAFPLLLTAVLGVLTEGMYGTRITSYDYYGVTMMIYCALYAATFSANSFMEERIKAPNLRIIYSPVGKLSIPLSKIIATFIFTAVFYSIAGLFMKFVFNVNFGTNNLLLVWLLFLAVDFLFSCIGVFMCCLFKSEGVANQILSIVTTLFAILSGFFFPIANLGTTMVTISKLSPVTTVVDTIFSIIYDQNSQGVLPALVIMIVLSAITILLCQIFFKGEDYLC
ncbi:ABC transporter permease [Enterococcus rivorum]|uniref:ABC transmembrane type-2 domain-containing protein n=1 Tax=Enterococcus rivorum TaxID=762845 RepID=A0A1E5KTE7_9ENTE|nr:ABC transporter permease [Enterococcus rivorum]MBP2098168.1 ABC-2 type transport system permease protein [Enterococcus rivorum]OEH80909.1 hypothetical protein BCR26_06670 [Enterococcus rivorum]